MPPYFDRYASWLGECPIVLHSLVPARKESMIFQDSGLSPRINASAGESHPRPSTEVRSPAPWQYGRTRVRSSGKAKLMEAEVTATVPSFDPSMGPTPPALPTIATVS